MTRRKDGIRETIARSEKTMAERPIWSMIIIPLITGLMVGLVILISEISVEDRRHERAERIENLRFVRERSSENTMDRPFGDFDLRGQSLSGLKLKGADLFGADLRETMLTGVDLSEANLRLADLRGAALIAPDFSGSDLTGADLRNINAIGSPNFRGADLSKVIGMKSAFEEFSCFDDETVWPTDYRSQLTEPYPAVCAPWDE